MSPILYSLLINNSNNIFPPRTSHSNGGTLLGLLTLSHSLAYLDIMVLQSPMLQGRVLIPMLATITSIRIQHLGMPSTIMVPVLHAKSAARGVNEPSSSEPVPNSSKSEPSSSLFITSSSSFITSPSRSRAHSSRARAEFER
jgi:hypothetical protein